MRKRFPLVLALILILGSFGPVFADTAADTTANTTTAASTVTESASSAVTTPAAVTTTPAAVVITKLSDIDGLQCEDAARVLFSLKVVSGYADGTYKPERTVTRAEMASLLIKALGLNETDAVPKFRDCQEHWAKGYIAYANTLGIIAGRTIERFDPDAAVTYDEAATMIVKALGYTDDALTGTYPANYVSRARVLGILEGIQSGAAGANRGDVAVMIYQAMDQVIGKVDRDGNFKETVIEWEKGKNDSPDSPKRYDTMLERLGAKVYQAAEVYDEEDQSFIVTGDEKAIINLAPYKGALISAYMNKDKDIIAVKKVYSQFISGTIDGDILNASDGSEYTMKSGAVDAINDPDTMFFRNGSIEPIDVQTDDSVNYTLAVDMSGKKIDKVYSAALWKVDDHKIIDAGDIKTIADHHRFLGVPFEEDNNNDIDLDSFELSGVPSLNDLKAKMLVYLYKNSDGKIARIAASNKAAAGEVAKVSNDEAQIMMGGKYYRYALEELAGNGSPGEVSRGDIEVGDKIRLTLDAYGYIYDFTRTDNKVSKYGVVLRVEDEEYGKISSYAKIELFLSGKTVSVFDVDADEIDDANIISKSGVWNTASITAGTIVAYSVNQSGVITNMNAAGSDKDDLQFVMDHTEREINKKGYLQGVGEVAAGAVLFNYKGTNFGIAMSDSKDDYSVLTRAKILDCDKTEIWYVYDTKEKNVVAIMMNNASNSADDIYGVVVSKAKNNSDAGAEFSMLINGSKQTKNGTNDPGSSKYDVDTTAAAPLFLIQFDTNGEVKEFDDWSKGKDAAYLAYATVGLDGVESLTYEKGRLSALGGVFTLEAKNGVTVPSGSAAPDISIDKDAVVYVYDKTRKDEWTVGTTSDLRNLGEGASVRAYDVLDKDGHFDIVLVVK